MQGPTVAPDGLRGRRSPRRTTAGAIPSSPFDAAVQAAQISLPQQDTAASTAAAASSTTHACGSEASVTSVTTQSAGDIAEVGTQIPAGQIYTI